METKIQLHHGCSTKSSHVYIQLSPGSSIEVQGVTDMIEAHLLMPRWGSKQHDDYILGYHNVKVYSCRQTE